MKLNIAYPENGSQKCFEFDDEKKLRVFQDKKLAQEVAGDSIEPRFKGYVFKITGGSDKDGFPMVQGVLLPHRTRLLLKEGMPGFTPKRHGERKRRSIRGCIVAQDIAVLNVVIKKKGPENIEGVTDKSFDLRLGPKRANKIRKLFALQKDDDVRKAVVRRTVTSKKELKPNQKPKTKAPKIQRLVTPARLHRKRQQLNASKARKEATATARAEYAKLLVQKSKEKREALLAKKRGASTRLSQRVSQKGDAKTAAAGPKDAKPAAGKAAAAKISSPALKKAAGELKSATTKGAKPAAVKGGAAAPKATTATKKAEAKGAKPSSPATGKAAAAKVSSPALKKAAGELKHAAAAAPKETAAPKEAAAPKAAAPKDQSAKQPSKPQAKSQPKQQAKK